MSRSTRRPPFQPRLEQLERRETPTAAATPSLDFLRRVMDQYHTRFVVSEDVSSAGNHFPVFAKFPNENAAVAVNGSWTDRPHSGATAIRHEFTDTAGPNFGGFYMQNGVLPDPGPPVNTFVPGVNFGIYPNAGFDLSGATALTFWARGQKGGERIEFFMGGVGRDATTGAPVNPYPDSTPVVKQTFALNTEWTQYRLDLSRKDLSYVIGGFGWGTNDTLNPGGAVFYVDDIGYDLSPQKQARRLNEPRLLRSFETLPRQPDPFDANRDDDLDFVLRNLAFTYDNALAIQAFLAEGTADGVRRARLIGDALVYAAAHDRTYTDGRLRTAYAAGDISLPPGWLANGKAGTTPVSGFYVEADKRFYEVEQTSVDTGNNAWAMLSLLALYRKTGQAEYLTAARRIGEFILTQKNSVGTYQGFLGGITDAETATPVQRPYASTEHNLDIYAAFTLMYQITGEAVWRDGAAHARAFVEAMWDPSRNCYLTGTINANTRNTNAGQLPLDVQAWSVLALPDTLALHPLVLPCAEANHAVTADGYTGFDFNDDRDGVWFEGTAQMAVAYDLAGQSVKALAVRRELRRAEQATGNFGQVAASRDGLTTGFGFLYFRRLHVGASAWNVFAQARYNPFTAAFLPTSPGLIAVAADAGGSPHVKVYVAGDTTERFSFLAYGAGFTGGVRVATGDLDGDGVADIVTGTGPGGGPHVKVFSGADGALLAQFFAYDPGFVGGVFVAVGDVDGDGTCDVITSADAGGGPHVQVFSGTDYKVRRSFFAYDPGFRGGVRVAVGDVSGDGRADIVVGAGAGGGPHVQVFSGRDQSRVASFFAYAPSFANGIYVAAGDVNGDGYADVLTGAGAGGGPHVQGFSGADNTAFGSLYAYDPGFTGGVRVAAHDLDGDRRPDLVTGVGRPGSPHVRVFKGMTSWYEFYAFDPSFTGGLYLG